MKSVSYFSISIIGEQALHRADTTSFRLLDRHPAFTWPTALVFFSQSVLGHDRSIFEHLKD
jgi:hypothetical protein